MYETMAKKVHRFKAAIVLSADFLLLSALVSMLGWIGNGISPWIFILPIASIFVFYFFKVYQVIWRFFGWHDLVRLWGSNFYVVLGVSIFVADIEWKFAVIYYLLSSSVLTSMRIFNRSWAESALVAPVENKLRTIIIGAGEAGEQILRSINKSKTIVYNITGFVDDDRLKIGARIHGVRVLGAIDQLAEVVKSGDIKVVLIAIPSAKKVQIERILLNLSNLDVIVKTLPSVDQIVDGKVSHHQFKDFSPEDFLGRDVVDLDRGNLLNALQGKKVFVTGAGGSIGSQLCIEICSFSPQAIFLFESNEFNLYSIVNKLSEQFPDLPLYPFIGDVRDFERLTEAMSLSQPDIVYHAAAYKHVPLMEGNSVEAITTNVFGTKNVLLAATRLRVERFVLISTDKAVNPTNVMGATKRVAELVCSVHQEISTTKIMAVRFGNVLGSSGSVIPRFVEQISKGGPVTVTHPEVTRYFMSIPEACQLVLQASVLGKGGEVFVLDMGDPVKIADLAKKMIRFSGKEGEIEIVYTGLRPGEKLYEELLCGAEETLETTHPKIKVAKLTAIDDFQKKKIMELSDSVFDRRLDGKIFLRQIIPTEYEEVFLNEK